MKGLNFNENKLQPYLSHKKLTTKVKQLQEPHDGYNTKLQFECLIHVIFTVMYESTGGKYLQTKHELTTK